MPQSGHIYYMRSLPGNNPHSLIPTDYVTSKDKGINLHLDALKFFFVEDILDTLRTLKDTIASIQKGSIYTVHVEIKPKVGITHKVGVIRLKDDYFMVGKVV